ncbi:MAG: hypothetical protein IJB33_05230 [Akkermansia sp.]|nr:hypothetical protein [Akkermansia sp.]
MKLLTPDNKLFNAERIDGAFDFYWQFQMDDESKKHEGYIVQKIVYMENYEHYKNSPPYDIEYVSRKYVYWEAWHVFQYGFILPQSNFNQLRWHDRWKMQPKHYYSEICSKGIITVNSLAFFIHMEGLHITKMVMIIWTIYGKKGTLSGQEPCHLLILNLIGGAERHHTKKEQ